MYEPYALFVSIVEPGSPDFVIKAYFLAAAAAAAIKALSPNKRQRLV
jgi:hypothetical protein